MFYVYILISNKDSKTYVGFTSKEPSVRLAEHNAGSNMFTSHNRPWRIHYYESFTCEKCARTREKFFKMGVGKKLRKIIIEHF